MVIKLFSIERLLKDCPAKFQLIYLRIHTSFLQHLVRSASKQLAQKAHLNNSSYYELS